MITQKSKELRLTFIQGKKNFDRYLNACGTSRLDFGKTTVSVTGDLELDGGGTSKSQLRKLGVNGRKGKHNVT